MVNDAVVHLSGAASNIDTSDSNGDYEFLDLIPETILSHLKKMTIQRMRSRLTMHL